MDTADSFIDSINASIVSTIEYNCAFERPWDGFGGLVSIGDSAMFREEGLLTALAPASPSVSLGFIRVKSSRSVAPPSSSSSSLDAARSAKGHRNQTTVVSKPMEPQNPSISKINGDSQDSNLTTSIQRTEISGNERAPKLHISTNTSSDEHQSAELQMKPQQMKASPRPLDGVISDVEKFRSRLIAVQSEGLSVKQTMIKSAAIAEDAFILALKKLKKGEYSDALLLADVADTACPASVTSAKNKIAKLRQSAQRRL